MKKEQIKRIVIIFLLVTCYLSLVTVVRAEVLERIVAIVDDEIILMSEYEEALQDAGKSGPEASGEKVLNGMIDRVLLLKQAERLRLGSSPGPDVINDEDALVTEYIDRRIKSFIHIPIGAIESYYEKNRERFRDREFYEVKDEIEDRLVNEALEKKLQWHLEELRRKAYIRVQL
ncbi:MAG: hypothetical protein HZA16_10040 [Nitrospirae bacterium]|nr:hypothetical protein [Nitrospirota bacterium]